MTTTQGWSVQGFVLALAALPTTGNFSGGLAAEMVHVSEHTLPLALHLAAGIVIAVVGLELMPEALARIGPVGADPCPRRRWGILHGY